MAIWLTLNKKYSWESVSEIGEKHQLSIPNWQRYDSNNTNHNSIRVGFASYNEEELYLLIGKLKKICLELKN